MEHVGAARLGGGFEFPAGRLGARGLSGGRALDGGSRLLRLLRRRSDWDGVAASRSKLSSCFWDAGLSKYKMDDSFDCDCGELEPPDH
ncbi:hypothetical protein chiPu_0013249 [Chiloscyllium punctatum]|uniref:Uncharacterized protein n=1 Tax=Chiloscyllium punctatum TaxID=137246 RepID=A0A401SWL8_CHIPU|nr:hypothetical protein [Chiloscyllium punctatum]